MFNDEQLAKLIENGKNPDHDHMPVVKLILPQSRCVWLLNEIDVEDPNIAFGLCDLGFGFPELGYVSLEELGSIRLALLGYKIEADPSFIAKYPMSVYADAARSLCEITVEDHILMQFDKAKQNRQKPSPG